MAPSIRYLYIDTYDWFCENVRFWTAQHFANVSKHSQIAGFCSMKTTNCVSSFTSIFNINIFDGSSCAVLSKVRKKLQKQYQMILVLRKIMLVVCIMVYSVRWQHLCFFLNIGYIIFYAFI